ncbi:MAG: tRNA preQ1(34) S-adenosylmethionine ribosyltransferase-isomerase QueA [Erysipelotrichaceae bacterium]
MKVSEFDFELPLELIAQHPLDQRSNSRLLKVNRFSGEYSDHHFYNIIDFLKKDDILVVNNTKVIPARLFGTKELTNAHVEVLLLKQNNDVWECLVGNAKVVKVDTIISFGDGRLKAKCLEVKDEGIRIMQMIYEGVFLEVLDQLGNIPLPPYIHEKLEDKDRYQTVYAKNSGSAAAPTAGLHFTPELLQEINKKGIEILELTLHIGLGTFRPIKVDDTDNHIMHSEYYEISEVVANKLNIAKTNHQRIIGVGTTSLRSLEANYSKYGKFQATKESTAIFIYPPYQIKSIDCLITNFHLPKSTLVMLVSAFSSSDIIKEAYNHAVKEEYRFFSFGDSMFLTNE